MLKIVLFVTHYCDHSENCFHLYLRYIYIKIYILHVIFWLNIHQSFPFLFLFFIFNILSAHGYYRIFAFLSMLLLCCREISYLFCTCSHFYGNSFSLTIKNESIKSESLKIFPSCMLNKWDF